jgi:hypothetical protein
MNFRTAAIWSAGAMVFGASAVVFAQSPAPPGGGLQILEFKPAFDDLMTMLIQPRHLKLYLAGKQQNWDLAAFELGELQASLRRIAQTIPNYRGVDVNNAVATIITPKIQDVDDAIKSADAALFSQAFDELTQACNICHQATAHPFLVITTPNATAAATFPNQDFGLHGAQK